MLGDTKKAGKYGIGQIWRGQIWGFHCILLNVAFIPFSGNEMTAVLYKKRIVGLFWDVWDVQNRVIHKHS